MTTFVFRALDRDGAVRVGRVEDDTDDAARARLAGRGLLPIELEKDTPRRSLGRGRVSVDELALGLRGLATLLEAGLPLDQALGGLGAMAPPGWRPHIPALRQSVREGSPLAESLAEQSFEFSRTALGIIRAGEGGSGLPAAVTRAAELLERQAQLRSAIRSALAYPLLLAFAGLAATVVLIGVVLPRFALILEDLGQELPRATAWVLDTAELARVAGLPLLGAAIAGTIGLRAWIRTETGRRRWHRLLLRAPLLRRVRRSKATAQACVALAALLRSGCPLPTALRHAAGATDDEEISARFRSVRERVARGERLARALDETEAMSATATRLLAAGERSGRLADMAERAGDVETAASERTIKRAVRLIEPALILSFGAVVAFVAAALLQAVYAVRPVP
ncbi:MAG: type II secretion system F family protein [Gemmatimonadetes bacterium]|nr:type II secretion system F family protein [Gemmatimonadota bacterium]